MEDQLSEAGYDSSDEEGDHTSERSRSPPRRRQADMTGNDNLNLFSDSEE